MGAFSAIAAKVGAVLPRRPALRGSETGGSAVGVAAGTSIPQMAQFSAGMTFSAVALAVHGWASSSGAKGGLPLVPTLSLAALRDKLTRLRSAFADNTSGSRWRQAADKLPRLHLHWAKAVAACIKACGLSTLAVVEGQ